MELKGMIEYDKEMNLGLLDHLLAHDGLSDDYILKLMSHILNAQHVWLFRIHNAEPEYDLWELHDMANSQEEFEAHYKRLLLLCEKEDREVNYKNSEGQRFTCAVHDILFHLVNHSNYHRAQINTRLVSLDRPAMGTDYIHYKRMDKHLD